MEPRDRNGGKSEKEIRIEQEIKKIDEQIKKLKDIGISDNKKLENNW